MVIMMMLMMVIILMIIVRMMMPGMTVVTSHKIYNNGYSYSHICNDNHCYCLDDSNYD